MKKEIRSKGFKQAQDFKDYLEYRVDASLSRFKREISSLAVWLEDMNGPKGGIDKRCRVKVSGPGIGELIAESQDSDMKLALNRAIEIVKKSVPRALRRSQKISIFASRALSKHNLT